MQRLLLLAAWIAPFLVAAPPPQPLRSPVIFEENRGQAPPEVKWLARSPHYQLFLTTEGATIVLRNQSTERRRSIRLPDLRVEAPPKPSYSAVRMKLMESRAWNEIAGLEPTGGFSNYFTGNAPTGWRTDIPHYKRVSAANVYDGIDLVFYSNGSDLEYDFVVAPGADPRQIRMAFEGADRLRLDDSSGDLILTTPSGSELRHMRPKVYQQAGDGTVEVSGGYEILDRTQAGFVLAQYDPRLPLIIDPTVVFTTFEGGTGNDVASAIAVDSSGNSYVTGTTGSSNFPIVNDLHTDQPGNDAFVTKLSPTGSILFSTYLGGDGFDQGNAIAVDPSGIFLTGSTQSRNFPTQSSLFSFFPGGYEAAFVTKLSLTGNALVYSTYLGGSLSTNDPATGIRYSVQSVGLGIALDLQHFAYVTGYTSSPDFPVQPSPGTFHGASDVFIAKIAPSGSFLTGSILLGGSGSDSGRGIVVDRTGSPWITGTTCSPNFPRTFGLQGDPGGCGAFVTRLSDRLDVLLFSTYLGGEDYDTGAAIAVDSDLHGYVTGTTRSAFFPSTAGSLEPSRLSRNNNAFLVKLNTDGHVIYSTYLGGYDGNTYGNAIAIDSRGDAYVAGTTTAIYFQGTPPLEPNPSTGFLCKISAQGNALYYTTVLGADIYGVAVLERLTPFGAFLAREIYTAGDRYTPSAGTDGFVVKLEETAGGSVFVP